METKGSMLSKLSKTDKNTLKALIKISTLTGGDETVAQLIETVISEQAKLKNIPIIEQAQQTAFQKGRIEELEKRKIEPRNTPNEETGHMGQTHSPNGDQPPTYALVVSSGSPEKKEVATLLRNQLDPLELDIPDATIRPGKEGIVVITSSKEDANKLLQWIQSDKALKQLKAKTPRENKIHVKVIGLEDDIDYENLPARIISQNKLTCTPDDIVVKKTWSGRRGTTAILALNRNGLKALGERTDLHIGWSCCPVFNHVFWPRCSWCANNGHIAPDCDAPPRCTYCGQRGHHQQDCEADTAHCNICEEPLTSARYCDIIDYVMIPYTLDGPFPDGDFLFQKDLSPVHTAKVEELLKLRRVQCLREKLHIFEEAEKRNGGTKASIARNLNIPESSLETIPAKKDSITLNAKKFGLNRKATKDCKYAAMEDALVGQLQPLDVGIIKYVKQKYRKFVVQHRLVCTERKQLDKKLYMLDAMHNIASAWDTTTSDTITNSFRHCGFNRSDFCSTSEAAVPVDDEPEFGSLQLLGTFTDYVGADDGVAVCSAVSLDDITKLCVLTLRKLPTRKRWMSRG
ncbi:hypothetical protein HPB52_009424 [Rhipicephalus sanguineus]|uniref:CCHC-type domain-containing protein n=1 Tax=Rhipicephalus sanguineus TaxID=34632 RepID=A0A9D4YMN3_RHISA|nr:hypothetical protein HPB52_009424 [Rhipicephalus sanguineus]